ncbi:DNA alkylation repair protein [Nitriliruptor alkaliphilus]|uniref:DNA alkylation repair protein n=1 Tax=Nitriliruptor alkaliphilus TaxID=427918 RepID=UPI0006969F25|nr:DNA alkylation repair protein [Nitriliruptor alkaliphilus]
MQPDAHHLADELERRLATLATPGRADQERHYLRSELTHLGTAVPSIRRTVKSFDREHPQLDHDEVWELAATLWDHPRTAPVHERRMAAVELLVHHADRLRLADLPRIERLVREARTWALLDPLAINVVGALVEREDEGVDPHLRRWATDDDRWVRRAALLAHLTSLRRKVPAAVVETAFVRVTELAEPMLADRDPMIRKAIGWVLREAGTHRPDLVTAWLLPRAQLASTVTVREAVRHLPDEDREAILAARTAPS